MHCNYLFAWFIFLNETQAAVFVGCRESFRGKRKREEDGRKCAHESIEKVCKEMFEANCDYQKGTLIFFLSS